LSASLKRYVWIGIIILSSSAILFFTFPERAKAQTEAPNAAFEQDTQNTYSTFAPSTPLVVHAGDSLWSISQERLGPNATPAQIADEVERIYALNREQIGDNPNLILVGQELLVPAVSNPATSEEPTAALEEPMPSELVVPEPIVDSEVPSNAPMAPMDEKAVADAPADEEAVSDAPTDEESAPVAASFADSLLGTYNIFSGRQLLGLGILALTLIVAILMVWKLPMRREIGDPTSWGVYQGYDENYALPEPAKELEGESGPVSEALKATQEGPHSTSPTTSEEAVPVPVDGEALLLSRHHRQERLKKSRHLRKIRQRRQPTYW
jgi:LysM repeat protein